MESTVCGADLIEGDADFHLIETFGFVPGQGIKRLELHLNRLEASARYFGIPFEREAARAHLSALTADLQQRCRLQLGPNGHFEVTTAPMPAAAKSWAFTVSTDRLQSGDLFLQHKSSRRAKYNEARANMVNGVDEILFLNERAELCEGTITNIVITTKSGERLTPARSSGCLPGVYRQSLIESGQVQEAVLHMGDLAGARAVHLVNSLRGETLGQWSDEFQVAAQR
ncbi:4-amino-4-deoxychorismate lyase [Epibacterium sp. SM1969]|uniref:Probable branched-chain-amino-acid aminotransferase n=1 Tax=Tritonibacter aquimaris TaxID=2663379 RepID=A0A844B1P4_9RHOB|nr:aminotransferase class IV family protein [Tritonibacter aquimaris]MQY43306.1 4-amino-4-deoxychorismate lyase [Tritonibacter aquimaris]